jgi:DNA-binding MarR family transcriptional regulator
METACTCITLRSAARKITAFYDEALAPLGLGVAQFSLLRKVERKGSISLTELASLAELDRSTVGRNVKVLEKAGLLRFTSGEDQREARVMLTDKGREVLAASIPLWARAQADITARIGEDALSALRRVADTL